MKQMCVLLRHEVEEKFPSAVPFTMGGYYFLRLVCPSIVSPDGFGILDREIDQKARRPLVLISKILQNLANETAFKEEYMQVMNEWMAEAKTKMNDFLMKLAQGPASTEAIDYTGIDLAVTPEEYKTITTFLTRTLPKFQKRFGEPPTLTEQMGDPLFDILEGTLNRIAAVDAEVADLLESQEKKANKKKKESDGDAAARRKTVDDSSTSPPSKK